MKVLFSLLFLLSTSYLASAQLSARDSLPGKSYDNIEQYLPKRACADSKESSAIQNRQIIKEQLSINTLKQDLSLVDKKIYGRENGQSSDQKQGGLLVQTVSLEDLKKRRTELINKLKKLDPLFIED